jgi:hypothetical protein
MNAHAAGTVNVTNGCVPGSNTMTFSPPGTFYWQSGYSRDADNTGAKSACNERGAEGHDDADDRDDADGLDKSRSAGRRRIRRR